MNANYVETYPKIPLLVKNHHEVNIEKLDKGIFNGIDTETFIVSELGPKEYVFKYKGELYDVLAVCIVTGRIIINMNNKNNNDEVIEKTVKFQLNLIEKDTI